MKSSRLGSVSFLLAVVNCLIFGQLSSPPAQASPLACRDVFVAADASPGKELLIKNYLALNLAFPQHAAVINLGLTALAATKPELMALREQITPDDYERVWTAMSRAHASHGVTAEVSKREAGDTMKQFFTRLEQATVQGTIRVLMLPEKMPRSTEWGMTEQRQAQQQWRELMSNPVYGEKKDRIVRYSAKILELLRAPKIREMSARLRAAAASQNFKDRDSVEDIVHEIIDGVAIDLAQEFPELGAPLASVYKANRNIELAQQFTLARALVYAMSGNPAWAFL